MNRIIKFRYFIKCIVDKNNFVIKNLVYNLKEIEEGVEDKIVEDIQEGCDGNSTCQINGFCECGLDYEDYEILSRDQYTDLKDKNGKEIYENDIVKYYDEFYECRIIRKIVFIQGIFMLEKWRDLSQDYYDCEIIGNVYENPELLTQEKIL